MTVRTLIALAIAVLALAFALGLQGCSLFTSEPEVRPECREVHPVMPDDSIPSGCRAMFSGRFAPAVCCEE